MGAAGYIGAGLYMGGNAAQAVGLAQANRAQHKVVQDAEQEQEAIDAENAANFSKLLDQQNPGNLLTDTAAATNAEGDPLAAIAQTVAAARGSEASAGASANTRGAITQATQGAAARGAYLARLQARMRAQALLDLQHKNQGAEYAARLLRLQGKSRGVQRLLPIELEAAKLKGAQLRAAGQTGSMLGQLLLQYGASNPSGSTADESSLGTSGPYTVNQAAAEAPETGWAAQQPGMA